MVFQEWSLVLIFYDLSLAFSFVRLVAAKHRGEASLGLRVLLGATLHLRRPLLTHFFREPHAQLTPGESLACSSYILALTLFGCGGLEDQCARISRVRGFIFAT